MKRFFTFSFITLAFVVGAAGATPAARADCVQGTAGCDPCPPGDSVCLAAAQVSIQSAATGGINIDPVAAKTVAGGLPKDLDGSEGFGKIMIWIMNLFAWLVGVAALTLDYAVYYTVITMGDYVNNLSAVGVTWQIMRDIGNIVIIFGFLAIGICTILDVKWYGGGTSMLPKLLLAAVFLNFSLFMTEAIIDTGNLFATQFYTQIKGGQMPTQATLSQTTIENGGISSKIMSQLGLQTIYGEVKNTQRAKEILERGNSWIIGFMGIILFLITAFVMFSLAFVLIARFVILLFLIIIAPIGFAGFAIPNLSGLAKKWWDKLVEQTITAPVLLLCLYIALAVITDAQFLTGFGGARDSSGFWLGFIANGNLQGFASVMLSFLVAMGLLLAVVIISKQLSAFGAGAVSKFGNSITSGATKFAMGSAKFAGRSALNAGRWGANRTAGRISHMASQGLMRTGFGQTQLGRLAATGLGKAGKGFKEAKEKSAKTHEEYRDSVAKALEEKHTPVIADAMQNRAIEQAKVTAIADKHSMEDKPLIDEVKRLEKIVSDNEVSGKKGFDVMAVKENLIKAKRNLETRQEANKGERNAQFNNADIGLTAAKKKEKEATDALAKAKREAAVAYGESARTSVTENPLTWVMSGPGGSAAGNKIIKDTLKSMTDVEKSMKILKDAWETEAKATAKTTETTKKLNVAKESLTEKVEKETETKP